MCFGKIAQRYPEHSFVFISEKIAAGNKDRLKNIRRITINQQSKKPLLWKLWYNYKLPALLRKINADVLVNADGICSLRTKVPQLLLVNNLVSINQQRQHTKKYQQFMLANQQAFLQKASHLAAANYFLQQQLRQQYNIAASQISVLYPGADENYLPLSREEREQIKANYTEGKEYFLFAGTMGKSSNLINLLKAFSFFKKRQKSNMQLIIISDDSEDATGFKESLDTYKFRKEVIFLQNQLSEELYKITAAAYAFVSPSLYENNFTQLLSVLHCKVPAIVSSNEINRELMADAVLYADHSNFEDIADKMMLLFKDEDGRSRLIEKGVHHCLQFSWQQTAELLWQNIEAAIQ